MLTRLRRLRRLSREELRWRVRAAMHTLDERMRTHVGSARWDRQDIGRVIDRTALALDDSLARCDWRGVHDAIAERMTGRRPRFVLNVEQPELLRQQIRCRWPAAHGDAAARADRLLRGQYNLLGYRDVRVFDDTGQIDWHRDAVHARHAPRVFYGSVPYLDPAVGDHKVIWELNRHQHWLQLGRAAVLTGDSRYSQEIVDQLDGWLAANPPLVGINWASMLEIALRAISWTWAAHCLLGVRIGTSPWLVDMLVALDRQLTHVEHHLSCYFSPNTHLTGEALALYVVGTALPELAASGRWVDTGRRILLDEIDRQVLNDGGHVERSTHYQRYTLDFYLLATLTARLAGDAAAQRFADAARRLAEFTRTIADDCGRLPLIGDDDGGMLWPITGRACADVRDSLAVAATVLGRPDLAPWGVTEEVLWIAGPQAGEAATSLPPSRSISSRLLSETGYFVARGADGWHGVFDVGRHGYLNGGHAHADALSLTLTLKGQPVLVDPGTATYTMDAALRDRMRSSHSHNTVTLDDRSPSVPAGPFHWRSTADARVVANRHNAAFDWIEGTHDGYRPARHRRTVVRADGAGWLIVDRIHAEGGHRAAAYWHFEPSWQVTDNGGRIHCTRDGNTALWMLHHGGEATLFRGDAATGLGWYSPVYGVLAPTWTARIGVDAQAPFTLISWVGDASQFRSPYLHAAPAGADAAVVEIVDIARRALFLIRPSDSLIQRPVCRAGGCETDALLLHYVEEGGRLRSLSLAAGRCCITARDGWLSVAAGSPIGDLHITANGDVVDLQCSAPPPELTVHGTASFTAIRANGRELPLSSKSAPDTLLIHGSDWADFSAGNPANGVGAHSGAAFARE